MVLLGLCVFGDRRSAQHWRTTRPPRPRGDVQRYDTAVTQKDAMGCTASAQLGAGACGQVRAHSHPVDARSSACSHERLHRPTRKLNSAPRSDTAVTPLHQRTCIGACHTKRALGRHVDCKAPGAVRRECDERAIFNHENERRKKVKFSLEKKSDQPISLRQAHAHKQCAPTRASLTTQCTQIAVRAAAAHPSRKSAFSLP